MDLSPASTFAALIEVWNGGDPAHLADLISDDYVGHMLHLTSGERSGAMYADWIAHYRETNPGVRFEIEDQTSHDDKLWSRLTARSPEGSVVHGMNISRFVDGKIAEEWAIWAP